jgi:hypothetical protein
VLKRASPFRNFDFGFVFKRISSTGYGVETHPCPSQEGNPAHRPINSKSNIRNPTLLDPVKYSESLQVLIGPGVGDTVIYAEDQSLYTYVKLFVVAVIVFGEVVYTDDLIQL